MSRDLESGNDAAATSEPAAFDVTKPEGIPSQDFEHSGNHLSFRSVDAVDVLVKNLSVDIDVSPNRLVALLSRKKNTLGKEVKPILKGVDLFMPSGTLTAIIGSSGSGKTSVLNALSHRIGGGRLETSGIIKYNDNSKLRSIRSAYVMQQDVLLPTLTVRETLEYAAELRLPPPTTSEEKKKVVEQVILELGLKDCANTRIGNNVHKGCSGGEKRRTSLAVQMLANPSVLFLDEVTTGLDASTAFQLISTLKTLAESGRTIVCTIHQPRSEIWNLFDDILLLAGGSPLYSGIAAKCVPYFENMGYVLPPFVNPAEYLIDLAAVDTRSPEAEEMSSARVQSLIRAFDCSPEKGMLGIEEEKKAGQVHKSIDELPAQVHAPLGHQIKILTQRTLKVTIRDPMGVAGSLFEAISMAIITGWIFLQLDGSLSGIRSREGALYTAASLQGYLILIFECYRLTVDIQLFDREYSEAGKEKMTFRSLEEIRTLDITLNNYSLDIQKRNGWLKEIPKISILKSLNVRFMPGVLNVIIGPSGSGKTSLLNSMAHRLHSSTLTKYQTDGDMLFNGAIPSEKVIRSICSYVCQDDDAILPYLTVRENLHFSAGLRLPAHLSNEEKQQRAESVLLKMGLRDCANNLVGSDLVKGISGGEKRRVTIAIQILTDPRVLFLDEPTSGLDAFTASSIIEVLRGLAEEGRTLVLTIHQARSDLFKYFDNMLLFARGGSPVYAGKGSLMLSHFENLGFSCPITTNPADFALDLITVNLQTATKESTSREKVRSLILEWDQSNIPLNKAVSRIATPAELGSLARGMTPFRIAFPLLLHRSFINFRRNPPSIVARTTQVLGYSICVTLFFAPLKSDYYSVQTRLGFIQEFAPLYFVGMLQNVAVYPDEKAVFYHEHEDNAYSVEAFFLQYTLAEIPFEILTSLLFAILTVLAAGLHRSASLLFIVAFNAFCIVNCGESVGIIFNTLFDHTGFAVNVTSVVLSLAQIMGGVMSLNVPPFLQAFNHLSPIKWAIGNLGPYTLRGVKFTCTESQLLPNGQCPVNTGEDALDLYNLNGNAGLNLLALGICLVVYRMLAYVLLKAKKTRWALKERLGRGRRRQVETVGASRDGEHDAVVA
ncbi:hypothetical protein P7C71_g3623, partial [Lecanoromycetidae sp. Uapishka_2]